MTACAALPRKHPRSPPPTDDERSPARLALDQAGGRRRDNNEAGVSAARAVERREPLTLQGAAIISALVAARRSLPPVFTLWPHKSARASGHPQTSIAMPNTSSARKAVRQIARRTEINKARRSQLRSFVRKVEEAIAGGNRSAALAALNGAEPVIMRAAQKGVVHPNAASRKVSRLAHRVAKLATKQGKTIAGTGPSHE